MGDISIQKLKVVTGQYDPELMFKISLAKSGISTLPASLQLCLNLTVLDVSFNILTSVEPLSSLKYLKTLILVSNKIDKLDSFKNLQAVEQIYLQNNKVKFISELNHLVGLGNLKVLSLQSLTGEDRNPVCDMSSEMYRDTIIRKLPQLQVLDEASVSEAGIEFYGAVRDSFDPDAETIFIEAPNWSKVLPWKEKPIHVKVKLDTSEFKGALDGCNTALTSADVELQKLRDRIATAQDILREKLRQSNTSPQASLEDRENSINQST